MIFLISGALLLIGNNELAMKYPGNLTKFSGLYFNWIGSLISNSIMVTGNVIKMEWIPANLSVSNST